MNLRELHQMLTDMSTKLENLRVDPSDATMGFEVTDLEVIEERIGRIVEDMDSLRQYLHICRSA